MSILNTGFGHLSDPDFIQQNQTIITSMGKPAMIAAFPGAAPIVMALGTGLGDFEAAVLKCNSPDGAITRETPRETAREAVMEQVETLALHLEGVSHDRALLVQTGFPLHKIVERDHTPTGTPENVTAKPTGIAGEAKLDCKGVHNVLTYEYAWTLDPVNGPWTHAGTVSNKRHMLVTGLQRGKDTWFRIRAFGPNGTGPWSDPATMMVI